jgi:phage tail-like protein
MSTDRHGPLRPNRFKVELDGITIGGFKRVEIPSQRTQQIEYREGNEAAHQKRLWGKTSYDDLILERGAKKKNGDLYKWRENVQQGKMDEARKNIAVILQDETGESHLRWNFTDAWPQEYQPPTLDSGAGGGENIATETYVVTFDEMERKDV